MREFPATIEDALSDDTNRGWFLKPVYPILPTNRNAGDVAIDLADLSFFLDREMNRWSIMVAFLGFGFVFGYCMGATRTQIAFRNMIALARENAAAIAAEGSPFEHDSNCPNHPATKGPSIH